MWDVNLWISVVERQRYSLVKCIWKMWDFMLWRRTHATDKFTHWYLYRSLQSSEENIFFIHTHTHTHTYICMYIMAEIVCLLWWDAVWILACLFICLGFVVVVVSSLVGLDLGQPVKPLLCQIVSMHICKVSLCRLVQGFLTSDYWGICLQYPFKVSWFKGSSVSGVDI